MPGLARERARVRTQNKLPDVTLHRLVDLEAFERGSAQAGETCEIDGIGPVSVEQARELAGGAPFVTASLWDGAHVERVARLGRCDAGSLDTPKVHEALDDRGVAVQSLDLPGRDHVPEVLNTALMIRDRTCNRTGCDQRWRLQRDHVTPVGLGGRTSYHNLQRLCWSHHQAKTERDVAEIRARRRQRADGARAGPAP